MATLRRRSLPASARALLFPALLSVVCLSGGVLRAQDDVRSLFDKGLALFAERDFTGAREAFEKAFAMNPTNDAVAAFVERAQLSEVFRMLRSEDRHISGIGRRLLELAEGVRSPLEDDAEATRNAVREALEAEGQDRLVLTLRHTAQFGRNLVPELITLLDAPDIGRRTAAINWIRRIGRDAAPVLHAARKHPSAVVRENVASILGAATVRHATSLATLKAMVESDESASVRAAAEESFRAILADLNGSGQVRDAKEYFVLNAREYATDHNNPFAIGYAAPRVFHLAGDQIVGHTVARFQLGEFMAKAALEEALDLDPSYDIAHVMTVYNDCAILAEYEQNSAYYAARDDGGSTKEILAAQQPYIDYVLRNRVRQTSAGILYAALSRSIREKESLIALQLIQNIAATGRRGELPPALMDAVKQPDSRLVRIAASSTIAFWNPSAGLDDPKAVATSLAEAALSSGVRTVQRVMGDSRRANRFAAILRQLDMEAFRVHESVEAGYQAVLSAPPDMILMDDAAHSSQDLGDAAPVNHFVTLLRRDYRAANIPVIVVVGDGELAMARQLYESAERKVWVVPDSIDAAILKSSVLDEIFAGRDDDKARATALAAAAASAIEYLSSVPTSIPVSATARALTTVLTNRPDEVRLPVIRALGNMRVGATAGPLAQVASAADAPLSIRVAAMNSLGQVLADTGPAPDEILKVILDGMEETDLALRGASWFAFSNAQPPADVRYRMLTSPVPAGAGPVAAAESAGDEDLDAAGSAEDENLDLETADEDDLDLEGFDDVEEDDSGLDDF